MSATDPLVATMRPSSLDGIDLEQLEAYFEGRETALTAALMEFEDGDPYWLGYMAAFFIDDPREAWQVADRAWRNFVDWGSVHEDSCELVFSVRSGGDGGEGFFKALKAARPDLVEGIEVEVDPDAEHEDPEWYESLCRKYGTRSY